MHPGSNYLKTFGITNPYKSPPTRVLSDLICTLFFQVCARACVCVRARLSVCAGKKFLARYLHTDTYVFEPSKISGLNAST